MNVPHLEWFYSFLGLKGSFFVSSVHTNTTLLGFFDILDLSHFNFLPSIVTKNSFPLWLFLHIVFQLMHTVYGSFIYNYVHAYFKLFDLWETSCPDHRSLGDVSHVMTSCTVYTVNVAPSPSHSGFRWPHVSKNAWKDNFLVIR